MTADPDGSTRLCDRWSMADQARVWEKAEVIGVDRSGPLHEPRPPEPWGHGTDGPQGRRNGGTAILRLRLTEPLDALPGQYVLVRLHTDSPLGRAEHAYSLCSSPHPPTRDIEIAVREVPHGHVSTLLARATGPGDILEVRGPFGFLTWTERDGGPLGLVGAGTGVSPLASIIRYAAARGVEVPMTLLCSSRDRSDVLLGNDLDALHRRMNWFDLVHTFTRAPDDSSVRHHRRVDLDMLADVFMAASPARRPTSYYVAGPGAMVIAVRAMLGTLGVTDERIYCEDHA